LYERPIPNFKVVSNSNNSLITKLILNQYRLEYQIRDVLIKEESIVAGISEVLVRRCRLDSGDDLRTVRPAG
jgi:hypothetical protein